MTDTLERREAIKAAVNRARHEWICTHGVNGMGVDDAITDAILAALATTPAPREKLEADLVEAKKALEPFAAKVADIGDDESDIDLYRPSMRYNEAPNITVGDIRRAEATLNRLSGEG